MAHDLPECYIFSSDAVPFNDSFFCFRFNMFEKILSIYDGLNARNEFCDL